ncbi:MAG TPA: NADP-dependent oxidoreductase [Ramlibacter sp.]|nr:NADP-dependent oxidoreductase [Ramlibacter sp.]
MLAITFDEFGGPDVLRITELPKPVPGAGEVVVRVAASPVNPTDILMRTGQQVSMMTGLNPPYIAGMEFAGHVDSVGNGVSGLAVGQPVIGVVNPRRPAGGAHTQFVCVPAESVATLDPPFNLVEAATVPMNSLTAQMAIDVLRLPRGSTLVVTGAAGVLGGYVIQLAKRAGLFVIADAKESDVPWLRSLGVDEIVPRGEAMYTAVRQHWPKGVDGLVDTALLGTPVGALVRDGGIAVSVRKTHPIQDPRLRQGYVSVIEQMRNTAALQQLARLLQDGAFITRVEMRLPMTEAAQAHRITEKGGLRGRVVLTFAA